MATNERTVTATESIQRLESDTQIEFTPGSRLCNGMNTRGDKEEREHCRKAKDQFACPASVKSTNNRP
eukprot:m.172711 g.172711  ORF g.172711 m.172711 type:complete len:68 (+) comp39086_c0_seq1:416-619(+)